MYVRLGIRKRFINRRIERLNNLHKMLDYESTEPQMITNNTCIFLLRSDKRGRINVHTNSICNKCYRGFIMLIGRPAVTWHQFTYVICTIATDSVRATFIKITLNMIMDSYETSAKVTEMQYGRHVYANNHLHHASVLSRKLELLN